MAETKDGSPVVQFRAGLLLPEIEARSPHGASLGQIADRDLERYYRLLADELAPVAARLTEGEASLIADALNGTLLEASTYRFLWAEIDDAIRLDDLADKWHVDGPRLVETLRALSPGATLAVVDAAERFWRDTSIETPERLRQVGLVRD